MSKVNLTPKMRAMLDVIPDEWTSMKSSPNVHPLPLLERRGLVEIRVNPSTTKQQAILNTTLGMYDHWQVRKVKPGRPEMIIDDPLAPHRDGEPS